MDQEEEGLSVVRPLLFRQFQQLTSAPGMGVLYLSRALEHLAQDQTNEERGQLEEDLGIEPTSEVSGLYPGAKVRSLTV